MIKYVQHILHNHPFFSTFVLCFASGVGLEFTMINWTAGETNFYSTYRAKNAKRLAEYKIRRESW